MSRGPRPTLRSVLAVCCLGLTLVPAPVGAVTASGTNPALIGHAGFSCPVLGALAWSEAAIFKPDGVGGTLFVTRVLWDAWAGMP